MNKECWAIIPARGGSKGVKGKNIKLLGNRPLIAHTIEALKLSNFFSKIIVTSDDEKILDVSKNNGAEIFLRSDEDESNDFTMPDVPTISCLKSFPKKIRPEFSFMIQCTSPFIEVTTYKKAFHKLCEHPNSTVFAAHIAHFFLWEKKYPNNEDSDWLPINHPFHERLGRQYIKRIQVNETGAFYGFPTEEFINSQHRFFSKAFPIILENDEIVDINTESDWNQAEHLFKLKNSNEN